MLRNTNASAFNSSLLSEDDWQFVHDISIKFPNAHPSIVDRFKFFQAMPAEVRPVQALIGLREILRQGLIQRGYDPKYAQSVFDHSKDVKGVISKAYKAGVLDAFLSTESNPKQTIQNAFRKAMSHDLPEVLTTDFTPLDMEIITREDKTRLEELAAKILYEAYPQRHQDFHEYEAKQGKDDILVKIADFIAWAGEAVNAYATAEYFNEETPETLESIMRDTRAKMQKYPEAYESFGNAYLLGMELLAENLLPEISAQRRDNPRTSAATVLDLAVPSAA